MADLSSVTGPVSYAWSGPLPVAIAFRTYVVGETVGNNGVAYFGAVPVSPEGGTWPAGIVLTPSSTYPGTFTPASATPTGCRPAMFLFTPAGPGSGTFSMTASGAVITPVPTVTVTNIALALASSIMASSPVETVVGTLSTQASGGSLVNPVLSLVNTAGGNFKLVGSQVRFAVGNVSQRSFVIRARVTSDNATAFEQDLAITVAGQLLSGVTYLAPGPTGRFFVLYKVAGAIEEGARFINSSMPGNLTLLVPQTAGDYTIRVYDALTGGNVLFETTQINVTAAPGPLPAQVTQTADTGVTQTGFTMNWTSTATSYRLLARPSFGVAYGSLVDATVSTNSYTFTGFAEFSAARAIVIPQNANGFGPPSGPFLSSTSF